MTQTNSSQINAKQGMSEKGNELICKSMMMLNKNKKKQNKTKKKHIHVIACQTNISECAFTPDVCKFHLTGLA